VAALMCFAQSELVAGCWWGQRQQHWHVCGLSGGERQAGRRVVRLLLYRPAYAVCG
jgi:hypothetical protein